MTFLKITDPAKRDFLVQELINKRREIFQDSLSEKFGDIAQQRDMSKIFKPITDKIESIPSAISSTLEPTLKALPESIAVSQRAITLPQYPTIQAVEDVPQVPPMELGDIASEYLRNFASKSNVVDKTFGIHDVDGKFYIGNKEVRFDRNDIILDNEHYKGTVGLWELITSKQPDDNLITTTDRDIYKQILHKTSALKRNYDPDETHARASKGNKWNELLGPIWTELYNKTMQSRSAPSSAAVSPDASSSTTNLLSGYVATKGTGIHRKKTNTIILPSDPTALLDRLDLLLASKLAGNTGVRNELIAICDELRRQGVYNDDEYKTLMLAI